MSRSIPLWVDDSVMDRMSEIMPAPGTLFKTHRDFEHILFVRLVEIAYGFGHKKVKMLLLEDDYIELDILCIQRFIDFSKS